MTIISAENWIACPKPAVSDKIRWREPLWAEPSKPRGKPDKIGEQMIIATVISAEDLIKLQVHQIERLPLNEGITSAVSKIKTDDIIRRKPSSLALGDCQKLEQ